VAAARTDPNPVMTSAMDVLDALRQRGYEPRDDAALGEGWFDRCLGDATLRVILTDDEVHLCAFDKYMALEWDARFPCGCPAAVILAALSAAETTAMLDAIREAAGQGHHVHLAARHGRSASCPLLSPSVPCSPRW
jgi:hypothetical protein